MPIYRLGEHRPVIHPSAYVHDTAVIIGAVTIGARSTVWPGAVVRGDNDTIEVGEESNLQDNCVLHTDPGLPMRIGSGVTVGHQAMLHGCTVGDASLIGIQAVILNSCVVGRQCLVGACALLTERKVVEDGHMAVGSPARVLRPLQAHEIAMMAAVAQSYVRRGELFRAELERIA